MNKETFVAYWGGYFDSPLTLDKIPEYVDVVILAFASPKLQNSKSIMITDFLCSKYSDQTIISWVKQIQSRGQKVLMSILDTPQTHWNVLNIPDFANSMKQIAIDKWGCDGIDIDAESGMPENVYIDNFIELIKEVRLAIGNSKILTYTCYTGTGGPDGEILGECIQHINWLNLMAYFDDYQGMINLYQDYAKIAGNSITIGVKAGTEFTDLEEVKQLCHWEPEPYTFCIVIDKTNGKREIKPPIVIDRYKKGIMLWTLNRDCPSFTQHPNWTWTETIRQNLFSQSTTY